MTDTGGLQMCPDCNDWLDPEEDFGPDAEVCLMCEKTRRQLVERPPTVEQIGDPRGKNATWKLMPVDTSHGECSQCGRLHEPDQPHDQQSLHYQYAFYAEHDRWPTWADAMAHCAPDVQQRWTEELRKHALLPHTEL